MEGIIHIRIDDRLIHGQVATQWTNDLGATRIMAINDEVATNPTLKTTTAKYDKNAHAITVSGGSGGTIYYRTSTDNSSWGSWSTTKPTAADVSYTPSDSSWKVENVKQALDDLYNR